MWQRILVKRQVYIQIATHRRTLTHAHTFSVTLHTRKEHVTSTTFEHDAAPWRDPVNFEVLLHPMGTASCPFSVFQVPYEGQETRLLRPIISDKHTELSLELHNSMHDTNGSGIAHGAQPILNLPPQLPLLPAPATFCNRA